jgi:hypothetical protein
MSYLFLFSLLAALAIATPFLLIGAAREGKLRRRKQAGLEQASLAASILRVPHHGARAHDEVAVSLGEALVRLSEARDLPRNPVTAWRDLEPDPGEVSRAVAAAVQSWTSRPTKDTAKA